MEYRDWIKLCLQLQCPSMMLNKLWMLIMIDLELFKMVNHFNFMGLRVNLIEDMLVGSIWMPNLMKKEELNQVSSYLLDSQKTKSLIQLNVGMMDVFQRCLTSIKNQAFNFGDALSFDKKPWAVNRLKTIFSWSISWLSKLESLQFTQHENRTLVTPREIGDTNQPNSTRMQISNSMLFHQNWKSLVHSKVSGS